MAKRALIVDDSPTAQMRLKIMLKNYDLEVDFAKSGEEALGYLSYQIPSVVFMDHLMTGMDGFEALKIIKSNPDTAMIPVVMYTSKSGDVYLGQARALGAMDVISKDSMEPSNLARVMNAINIQVRSNKQTAQQQPARKTAEVPEASASSKKSSEKVAIEDTVEAKNPSTASKKIPAVQASKSEEPVTKTQNPFTLTGDPELADDENKPTAPAKMELENSNIENVRRQVAKSLEMNLSKVRQDIATSSRLVVSRLAREIGAVKKLVKQANTSKSEPIENEVLFPEAPEQNQSGWLILLLLTVVGILIYGIVQQHSVQEQQLKMGKNIARLNSFVESEYKELSAEKAEIIRQTNGHGNMDSEQLLSTLSWAINQGLGRQLEYGQLAVDHQRLSMLTELTQQLNRADFRGTVRVDIYLGNYCVSLDNNGELAFPGTAAKLNSCALLSHLESEILVDDHVLPEFLMFVKNAPVLREGNISMEVKLHAYDEAAFDYPEFSPYMEAKRWNDVARLNHQVNITILSEQL